MASHDEVDVDRFTPEEVGYLQMMVRTEVRRQEKRLKQLGRKFGDEMDPSGVEAKIKLCEKIYRKLGRNPNNITYMEEA